MKKFQEWLSEAITPNPVPQTPAAPPTPTTTPATPMTPNAIQGAQASVAAYHQFYAQLTKVSKMADAMSRLAQSVPVDQTNRGVIETANKLGTEVYQLQQMFLKNFRMG